MQQRQKMGDLLRRLVPLSWHDVDEILHEQRIGSRRFGETAIAMGLCRPEHVWQAWCGQRADQVEPVDLDQVGIDSQAVILITREMAMKFGVIPLRVSDEQLIIAAAESTYRQAISALPAAIRQKIKFVIAPDSQVWAAIASYYPE
jgi:type IV pilus assembly protein PilB